ncbi:cation:proton antiporter [Nonomuraea sp. MTCD27]|uniref:cation:proton antiporter domain-containing protein n=1 Tax=Nonomuraea sp. MTCD27 TaxID=1676747 RepID=UPI0035BFD3D1
MHILLLDLALILALAKVMGALAQRLGQPAVVGEIVAGVVLGPTLLSPALTAAIFPGEVRPVLNALAQVGVALFMFVVGTELDLGTMKGGGRLTVWTSLFATAVPLALGGLLAATLLSGYQRGPSAGFVLFFAVAMSVTAFPVLARIIADRGMTGTRMGSTALTCAAVCDLLAWSLLALVVAHVTGARFQWWLLLLVPYVVVMVTIVRPLLRRASEFCPRGEPAGGFFFAVVLGGLLVSAAFTEWLGLHYIFGAFLFGALLPRGAGDQVRKGMIRQVEPLCATLLLPVYFVMAGLKIDLSGLTVTQLAELALILATAVIAKFGGTYAGARIGGLDRRGAITLGALLNTRGLTELVVLGVGLELGVLDDRLYSLMVVMAVVTTVLAGPLLSRLHPPSAKPEPEPERTAVSRTGADTRAG